MKARALLYAGLVIGMASSANAATFFDGFESDATGTSKTTLTNWTVTTGPGNVDVIGAGSSWDYLPGNGHYLDLLGSSGPSTLSTNLTFAAGSYHLEFKLAGNQNGGHPEIFNEPSKTTVVKFGTTTLGTITLAPNDPFALYVFDFTAATAGKLSFASLSQPDLRIGNLLDDVALSQTPLPAALPLFAAGAGLIGAAAMRRRKRKEAASLAAA